MASQAFSGLLLALLSNRNEERKAAERTLEQHLQSDPGMVVTELAQTLQQHGQSPEAITCRMQAAVLLRIVLDRSFGAANARILGGTSIELPPTLRPHLKRLLLETWATEPERLVQRKVAHTIAKLANQVVTDGEDWPEVLQALSVLPRAPGAAEAVAGLDLIERLAEFAPGSLASHAESLLEITGQFIWPQHPAEVRLAAVKASAAIITEFEGCYHEIYSSLLPGVMCTLETALKDGDEATANDILEALTKIAHVKPKVLRFAIDGLSQAMLLIVRRDVLEESTRILAMEFLCTFCEGSSLAVRNLGWLTEALLPLLLDFLRLVDDDDDWARTPEQCMGMASEPEAVGSSHLSSLQNEEAEDEMCDAAASALDRLSRCLGPNEVIRVAKPILDEFLTRDCWRSRRAGLLAFSLLGEPCREQLSPCIPKIVRSIADHCEYPHPRVRYVSVHCLSRIAVDYASQTPSIQERFPDVIFPALAKQLTVANIEVPRLQSLAAAALINICNPKRCPASALAAHAQCLLELLWNLLSDQYATETPIWVKHQAITAVGCIASCLGSDFAAFYNCFVPLMKEMLQYPPAVRGGGMVASCQQLLHGKTCEAFGLMCEAVGKGIACQDANDALTILNPMLHRMRSRMMNNLGEHGELFDEQHDSYILTSVARLGKVLGSDFASCIDLVLVPALGAAGRRPDVRILPATASQDELNELASAGMVLIRSSDSDEAGGTYVGINTYQLQQKEVGCNTVYQYLRDFGTGLSGWVGTILPVLIDCLHCRAMEGVRIVAATSLSKLVEIMIEDPQGVASGDPSSGQAGVDPDESYRLIVKEFLDQIQHEDGEDELEALCMVADALSDILKVGRESSTREGMFRARLDANLTARLFQAMISEATHAVERRLSRLREIEEEGRPDDILIDEQKEIEEWEKDLLTSTVDACGWVVKSEGANVLSMWCDLVKPFASGLVNAPVDSGMPRDLRAWGLCTFIDVVEHCQLTEQTLALACETFGGCLQWMQSEDWELKQVCVYGIGVVAEMASVQVAHTFAPSLNCDVKDIWPGILNNLAMVLKAAHDSLEELEMQQAGLEMPTAMGGMSCAPSVECGGEQHRLDVETHRVLDIEDGMWPGSCLDNCVHAMLKIVECVILRAPEPLAVADREHAWEMSVCTVSQCMQFFPFQADKDEGDLAEERLRRWMTEYPDLIQQSVARLQPADKQAEIATILNNTRLE